MSAIPQFVNSLNSIDAVAQPRKLIGEHKARLRARPVQMCTEMKAGDSEALPMDCFFLLRALK